MATLGEEKESCSEVATGRQHKKRATSWAKSITFNLGASFTMYSVCEISLCCMLKILAISVYYTSFLKNKFICLFTFYFWLHWVFVAASGGYSSCGVQWPLIAVVSPVTKHGL